MQQTPPAPADRPARWTTSGLRTLTAGLLTRALLLTAAFVLVAEMIVFLPALADFRRNWLMQRLDAAGAASLAVQAAQESGLPERLRRELLNAAGARAITVKLQDAKTLELGSPGEIQASRAYDLGAGGWWTLMKDCVETFAASPGTLVHIVGSPDFMAGAGRIDAIIDETPLRDALWRRAVAMFWYALFISFTSVAAVYLALTRLLIWPVIRIARNMAFYRENPEDTARIVVPSSRGDEIGAAEKELSALQTQLTGLLREKARLANVGLAVSKINHDLRNMLAGAQLVSDRLASVADPTVQRFVPRLIRALDRAITLCSNTVTYGRSEEAPPKRAPFPLRPLIGEVTESLGAEDLGGVKISVSVPAGLELLADQDQIYRVLFNLVRNSLQALREADEPPERPAVGITALREGDTAILRVSDNGPGIPPMIRASLFKAFQAGAAGSGDGLGLAIAAEIVRAHGGKIELDASAPETAFVLTLPAAVHSAPYVPSDEEVFDGKLAQDGISR